MSKVRDEGEVTVIELEAVVGLDAESYFAMIYQEPYGSFQAKYMSVKQHDLIELEVINNGTARRRKMKMHVNFSIPGPLKRFVPGYEEGQGIPYYSTDVKDWRTRTIQISIEPPIYPNRIHIWGTIYIIPLDEAHCRQLLRLNVKIDAFHWIQKMVAEALCASLARNYSLIPSVVNAYVEDCRRRGYDFRSQQQNFPLQQQQQQKPAAPSGYFAGGGAQQQQQQQQQVFYMSEQRYSSEWDRMA